MLFLVTRLRPERLRYPYVFYCFGCMASRQSRSESLFTGFRAAATSAKTPRWKLSASSTPTQSDRQWMIRMMRK